MPCDIERSQVSESNLNIVADFVIPENMGSFFKESIAYRIVIQLVIYTPTSHNSSQRN